MAWSVPIVGSVIGDLNETIAKGPDNSWIGKLPDAYFQGKDQRYQQDQRDIFKNGIPNSQAELVDKLARVQGAAAAPAITNYYRMLYSQQVDNDINGTGPSASQPSAAPAPSSAPVIPPSPTPTVRNTSPAQMPGTGQPVASADIPTGTPAPPGQNITGPNTTVTGIDYGPVTTTPNQRVAQSFPSSGALVSPDAADPTLGGLVPSGRSPGQQRTLLSRAIASGMLTPEQSKNYQARIDAIDKALDQYRGGNVKNSELTPDQKNAAASGESSPLTYETNKAATTESNKQDIDTFQKRYTGLQSLGEQSFNGIQKAQLMKQLTLDPNFYSGPLSEHVQTYNQFKSIFGSNPSSALPTEAFNKVANDMLTEQVKAMGQSGVGRVLQTEVNTMKQSIASLGITPTSNRALAEIVSRVYKQNHDIAEIARSIPQQPGRMNRALDSAIDGYLKQHPLFTPQEIQHPATLGAPDAPPQSAQWNPAQKRAWAQRIGLKPGDAIRFNGQVVQVP